MLFWRSPSSSRNWKEESNEVKKIGQRHLLSAPDHHSRQQHKMPITFKSCSVTNDLPVTFCRFYCRLICAVSSLCLSVLLSFPRTISRATHFLKNLTVRICYTSSSMRHNNTRINIGDPSLLSSSCCSVRHFPSVVAVPSAHVPKRS